MINTVLFDMDGLLLDTEPLWGESMMRIVGKHGIPLTREQFRETTGLRIYEVTDYWAIKYPWEGSNAAEVADEILDDIIELSKERGRIMPGVLQLLDLLTENSYKIGLASSSPARMIHALVAHFGIADRFHCITSADAVAWGKPHPAVFLHCAESLGASPLDCLVLEDSLNGIIAGKAARMKVVAVPDAIHFDDPRFALADLKLSSLEDLDLETLKGL